jgi:tRNA pseudouridine38-40 synthase
VADCELHTERSESEVEQALRSMLPGDLRPLRVSRAAPEFDARRDARSKTYRYRLDRTRHGDPFRRRFALHWPHALDAARLHAALAGLPGRRDWSGFAAATCEIEQRVRTLSVARYEEPAADEAALVFSADGFLTHMVRNLVGTLLAIASGRMPVERVPEILAGGDRTRAGPTAAARGLLLERIEYEPGA